jgi:hypothetical protein
MHFDGSQLCMCFVVRVVREYGGAAPGASGRSDQQHVVQHTHSSHFHVYTD